MKQGLKEIKKRQKLIRTTKDRKFRSHDHQRPDGTR